MKLFLGNKNYSSWSLRGWLVARLSGAPFKEVFAPLGGVTPNPAYFAFSPSGLVPCLHDGDTRVWDTLSIAEYLAERYPAMWPADPLARAWARSITCEMHSGFGAMRSAMTMCIRERVDVRPWSPAVVQDVARVTQIWNDSRARFAAAGDFLCGAFSIADCFYAPVAFRFRTYAVAPDGDAARYLASLLAHPLLREWEAVALAETMIIDADEPRVVYRDKLAATGRL
ncbi:MAG: glutathione S-transferase family protein [Casimicrobiaceae bacterium]